MRIAFAVLSPRTTKGKFKIRCAKIVCKDKGKIRAALQLFLFQRCCCFIQTHAAVLLSWQLTRRSWKARQKYHVCLITIYVETLLYRVCLNTTNMNVSQCQLKIRTISVCYRSIPSSHFTRCCYSCCCAAFLVFFPFFFFLSVCFLCPFFLSFLLL